MNLFYKFKSSFVLIIICLYCKLFTKCSAKLSNDLVKTVLTESIYDRFVNSNLNSDDLKKSLKLFQQNVLESRNAKCLYDIHGRFDFSLIQYDSFNFSNKNDQFLSLISTWADSAPNLSSNLTEKIVDNFNRMCLDSDSLNYLFTQGNGSLKDYKQVYQLILAQFTNDGCSICNKHNDGKVPITKLETWGYGILFVTLISLSSLCGAFVIPFSKKKIYKKVLMFLIAIAVGSLAGSGFLHLIPQAYGINDDEKYSGNHAYVWKGLVMMGGVYLFYFVERIMKIMIQRKKLSKRNSSGTFQAKKNSNTSQSDTPVNLESIGYLKPFDIKSEPSVEMRVHISKEALENMNNKAAAKNNHHGHSHGFEDLHSVAPVAWMIIFGDGLHNFIDGLSIGAAFTESVLKGISICLAVICEEFPHELGDFAILINAGMSYPVALLFNFLSACCCFLGLAVGITLGENLGANQWIYAIAGGMFLYISLCDMIPELTEMGEEIERDYLNEKNRRRTEEENKLTNNCHNNNGELKHTSESSSSADDISNVFNFKLKIKILIIQNIGILFGFMFMFFMAIYSDTISLS